MLHILLHLFQKNSFIFSYVGEFLWGLIRKDCIEVQEKKNKVLVLCCRFEKNLELKPHFHFAVLQLRQRNVQKGVGSRAKLFFVNLRLLVLLFSRSRSRYCRRRRCSSSVLFTKEFAL